MAFVVYMRFVCGNFDVSPNRKVLEMGPLRLRKSELKVTLTRPFQLKGQLYER